MRYAEPRGFSAHLIDETLLQKDPTAVEVLLV